MGGYFTVDRSNCKENIFLIKEVKGDKVNTVDNAYIGNKPGERTVIIQLYETTH